MNVCTFQQTVHVYSYTSLSIVPVIENGGGTTQYSSSAVAGQLYTYRMSPSMSVLLTRGLPEDAGVAVGMSEDAAGVYQCVARNVLETDTETVNIHVINGLSLSQ